MSKKIVLVDGNSLMFRSYYATSYTGNLMRNKDGLYTNALFGFCNMLTKLLDGPIDHLFIAFDAGKQTFRHQQYSEYKGNRKQLPDELRVQIPYIKEYIDLLGIKRFETLDYEADDLIASVAKMEYDQFDEIQIISGDKDLLQLVNDKVKVCLTRKGIGELEEFNSQNFKEKMGIYPAQITDYKGLVGDSSDNLPGIKGVGEKTAIKLLNQYNTLENIYEHLNELTPKMQALFAEHKATALKCKMLATLVLDVPLDYCPTDFIIPKPNYAKLIPFLKQMEFNNILKRIDYKEETRESNYTLVTSDGGSFSGDAYLVSEVFTNNYNSGKMLGIGLISSNQEYFITPEALQTNQAIKEYLEDENIKKTVFDAKQLYFVLDRLGIDLKGVESDLLLSNYLINPATSSDDFKRVIENYKDTTLPYYENIYGANTKMKVPELSVYAKYAVDKCYELAKIKDEIESKIKELEVEYLLKEELKLAKVLSQIEKNGLLVDVERLEEIGKNLLEKTENIAREIYEIAACQFNINSPKQLGEILFEKLGLPHGKKNKTGYSTSVEVLEKLAKDYTIVKHILDYRAYNKLVTTYVNGINELQVNGYIHPLYKQALTLTGRLSSIEPNIQNMPIRTEVGQVIREIFVSRFENGQIATADYSQIELRVLAHMSNDNVMIDAFNHGADFHALTASNLFEIDLNDVTSQMRRTAKAINFGIIYGMSAWGLSEQLEVSPIEANLYINKYFYTYSQSKACLDLFINQAKELGYSKTLFNRRRYIPELSNSNGNLRAFGERTAMNSPIQGTAADIIKIAMNRVSERLKQENLKSLIIAQVHDELVFDCASDEVEMVLKIAKEEMEKAVTLSVPLVVSINSGKNWFEAK